MLTVYPQNVYEDSTGALVVLSGLPNRVVTWSLTGSGTLTPITSTTDALGRASAKYVPGTAGDVVTVQAIYGS